MSINILDSIDFGLDTNLLLKIFRMEKAGRDAQHLIKLANTASQIGRPKVLYKEAIVTGKGNDYIIVDGIKLTSHLLRSNVGSTQKIYPYILTCGTELADWAKSLNDILELFWADKIMELALTATITAFESHLEKHYNLSSTSNMNPGSLEDWPLSQQQPLFSILGESVAKIGVNLTDSCLMLPIKSLSGIRFHSEIEFVNCQLCKRENCKDRRMKYDHNDYLKGD